jgi:hypothetical protein
MTHLLIDAADDGYIEAFVYVEATVSADAAREMLRRFTYDAIGNQFLPEGPAVKVWMYLANPHEDWWKECTPHRQGAVEFWKIDCTVGGKQ